MLGEVKQDGNGPIGLTVEGLKKTPYLVPLEETVVQIASGNDHLCMLTGKGEIYTMGCGEQGQLGRIAECFSIRGGRKGVGILLDPSVVYCKRVRGKGKVLFDGIWCSNYCTFARVQGGGYYGWGLNNYHHLGLEDVKSWFTPQPILSFSDVQVESVAGGQHHTVLLDKEDPGTSKRPTRRELLEVKNIRRHPGIAVLAEQSGMVCVAAV
ncbi:regulator of chromosome condensation-like [Diadema antillarum]|uniref:regulator of chromosome condensation-like n=1 Tax=Diadema antillarum TaxID=105358 RepID=UPI003A8A5956